MKRPQAISLLYLLVHLEPVEVEVRVYERGGVVVDIVYGYGVCTLKSQFVSSKIILRCVVNGIRRTNAGSWAPGTSIDRASPVSA